MPVLAADWPFHKPSMTPYMWVKTAPGEFIDTPMTARLASEFPVRSFTRSDASTRTGKNEKTYRNYSLPVVDASGIHDAELSELWQGVVVEILAADYRERVAALFGQPTAAALEIRLVRHGPGDWLSPHTDREDKLFSHILYFNPVWRQEWGGCLEILRGPDPAAVDARVVPELGASVLLARAEDSWHQVTKVTAAHAPDRASLLIHGLR